MPNRVPVAVWHVLCPGGNEPLDRKADYDPPLESLVFGPKLDFSVGYVDNPMLRDWGTANISSRVAQKVRLRVEMIDVDAPPAFVLRLQ
jgi:hypothetical protein